MKFDIHKSNTRGHANHGWLNSYHSFSFAQYYNPSRMNFGLLRVLNDDVVLGGKGFGTHPHENMEIVSIPLKGSLAHKDSTGNEKVIKTNDVQIMSAGTGLMHSEYNASKSEIVNFLQLWVFPKERNIQPRYEQKTFLPDNRINNWQTVVAPDDKSAVWINQEAWLTLGSFEAGKDSNYKFHRKENGVYLFLIEGELVFENNTIERRDAIAISESESVDFKTNKDSEILIVEVPLS